MSRCKGQGQSAKQVSTEQPGCCCCCCCLKQASSHASGLRGSQPARKSPRHALQACTVTACLLLLNFCVAGETAHYNVRVSNTGAVRLKSLALNLPAWANVTSCTNNAQTATTAGPWTVDPHKALVCLAEYVFDQGTYEAGPLGFVASATSTELPLGVSSAPARTTPTYTPALELYKGGCTFPASARKHGTRAAAGKCSAAAACVFLQQALAVAAVCETAATTLPATHHGCCPFLCAPCFLQLASSSAKWLWPTLAAPA